MVFPKGPHLKVALHDAVCCECTSLTLTPLTNWNSGTLNLTIPIAKPTQQHADAMVTCTLISAGGLQLYRTCQSKDSTPLSPDTSKLGP